MPPPIIVDPKHCRERTARMQALALKMAGSLAAILMNDLAIHYENWPIKPRSKVSRRQTESRAWRCRDRRRERERCGFLADFLVGAPRFELGTPSPPDWCANRAALRSADAGGL
jgi:hypothetical protein